MFQFSVHLKKLVCPNLYFLCWNHDKEIVGTMGQFVCGRQCFISQMRDATGKSFMKELVLPNELPQSCEGSSDVSSHEAMVLLVHECVSNVINASPENLCWENCPQRSMWLAHPMERVAIHILGPLPLSELENKFSLVSMDYFTKGPEVCPLTTATLA